MKKHIAWIAAVLGWIATAVVVGQTKLSLSDQATPLKAGYGMLITINPARNTISFAVNPALVGLLGGPNVWTGNNDFSTAVHTTPLKVGAITAKPAKCTVGEMYFASDQPPGKNLFGCTAPGIWTLE